MRGYGEVDFWYYFFDAFYFSLRYAYSPLGFETLPCFISIKPLNFSMDHVVRYDPDGAEIIHEYNGSLSLIRSVGWWGLLHTFHNHNVRVYQALFQSFNGKIAHVGDLELNLHEGFVASTTCLELNGERWFKIFPIKDIQWSNLLKSKK